MSTVGYTCCNLNVLHPENFQVTQLIEQANSEEFSKLASVHAAWASWGARKVAIQKELQQYKPDFVFFQELMPAQKSLTFKPAPTASVKDPAKLRKLDQIKVIFNTNKQGGTEGLVPSGYQLEHAQGHSSPDNYAVGVAFNSERFELLKRETVQEEYVILQFRDRTNQLIINVASCDTSAADHVDGNEEVSQGEVLLETITSSLEETTTADLYILGAEVNGLKAKHHTEFLYDKSYCLDATLEEGTSFRKTLDAADAPNFIAFKTNPSGRFRAITPKVLQDQVINFSPQPHEVTFPRPYSDHFIIATKVSLVYSTLPPPPITTTLPDPTPPPSPPPSSPSNDTEAEETPSPPVASSPTASGSSHIKELPLDPTKPESTTEVATAPSATTDLSPKSEPLVETDFPIKPLLATPTTSEGFWQKLWNCIKWLFCCFSKKETAERKRTA